MDGTRWLAAHGPDAIHSDGETQPQPSPGDVIARLFAVALRDYPSDDLAEVEVLYRQILSLDGGSADTLHQMAVLAHQAGRHELAAELINTALAQDSHNAELRYSQALMHCAQREYEQALDQARRALAIRPDHRDAQRLIEQITQAPGMPSRGSAG